MVTIDFEFAQSQEWRMRVVCCVLQATGDPGSFDQKDLGPPERYWTDGPVNEAWMLKSRLSELWALGHVFVAYGATAEVRAMLSLEVDHLGSYRFIDLYAEWKQQQNNCNRFQYGCYFVAGRRFDSIPPEFEKRLNKGKNNKQVGGSLGACVGNLFQVDIDQARKNRMRDLIISNPPSFAEDEKQEILDYCESDIAWLPAILDRCLKELRAVTGEPASRILGWMELRGRWAVSLARMETLGIPLDVDAIFNLSANYEEAKDELIRDCNKTYPWFTDERKAKDFYPKWTAKYEVFAAFLQERGLDRGWPRTETGDYASDEKQLEAFDGIPELHALRVTKKALGQLKWFRPEALPEFLGDVGDDGRLRPFFGPWGTQSSRNAPPAKRFPPAMSAWLRCIMRPPKGSAICGIDWASQEFAGAAQISEDEGMQEAYRSGDPYVYFARSAGAIPKDATDAWIKSPAKAPEELQETYQQYSASRNLFKATCLAEGTAVLTNNGWKPIQTVEESDYLWDGEKWVSHHGVKEMGDKPTGVCHGIRCTADHRFVSESGAWSQAEEGRNLCNETKIGLCGGDPTWNDVRELARSIWRCLGAGALPLPALRRWVRQGGGGAR